MYVGGCSSRVHGYKWRHINTRTPRVCSIVGILICALVLVEWWGLVLEVSRGEKGVLKEEKGEEQRGRQTSNTDWLRRIVACLRLQFNTSDTNGSSPAWLVECLLPARHFARDAVFLSSQQICNVLLYPLSTEEVTGLKVKTCPRWLRLIGNEAILWLWTWLFGPQAECSFHYTKGLYVWFLQGKDFRESVLLAIIKAY